MSTASREPGFWPKSTLVIQLARFGDILQTKRLILSLQATDDVHLLVDACLTDLARLVYPGVVVHGLAAQGGHGPDILGSVHAQLGELCALDFDRVYNLNFSGLNFALASMFPASCVRGYRQNAGQRLIDSWPARIMRWTRRRTQTGINLVDVWGLAADQPVAPQMVNPPARPKGAGLGVVLAGRHARRSLLPRILAPLILAAYEQVGHGPLLLLGTQKERRPAQEIMAALPATLRGNVRNLVGQTSLTELFDHVAGLDLLLSPDTGTMHLAAHLGVPVLALFLSSAWAHETGPYGAGHRVLQASPECAPCLEKEHCAHALRCQTIFSDPAVLRSVSGRTDQPLPPQSSFLHSDFDELGLVWRLAAGEDRAVSTRQAFRALAGSVAGVRMQASETFVDDAWIQESDWMLPQTLPRSKA